MNYFYFEKLIKNVPHIQIELNWIFEEGAGHFEEEKQVCGFLLAVNFDAFQTGKYDPGDWLTEAAFFPDELSINNLEIFVFNKEGEAEQLTELQAKRLEEKIKSCITSN